MKSCSRSARFASLLAMIQSLALRNVAMLPFIRAALIVSVSMLPLKQFVPINISKEVVRLDSCGTIGTKTTLVMDIKLVYQKIPSKSITAREGQRLLQDLAVLLVGAFVVGRRQTRQHLVEPDTKGPLIQGLYEFTAS